MIEYGHRAREQCPDTWVFWVFAGSPVRFEQDFRKIAEDVQIPGRENPQADILTLVHNWLRDARNGKWLIIIDNADDDQIFLKSEAASTESQEPSGRAKSSQPLSRFLPQTDNGRILMTTRYRDVALKFVEDRDIITIEPMNESDALELLEKGIEGLTDRDSDGIRKELVAALEYMPLAIAQAAAYILRRALSRPIHRYLDQFQASDSKRIELLESEGGHLRRDWEAKNSILITWQISFDHLRQIRPSAADRLSLMSFFDRQGIPKILIREQTRAKAALSTTTEDDIDTQGESVTDNASESSEDDDDFEDDMLTLRGYSLVTFSGEESYEMHALVQLATRDWLANVDKLDASRRQFFKLLAREFPTAYKGVDDLKRFHMLYPHVKSALSQRSEANFSSTGAQALRDFATLMHRAGSLTSLITFNMDDAKILFKTALEVRIKVLGIMNMDTLKNKRDAMCTMGELALRYSFQCQWSKAKELSLEAFAWSESEFGLKHMETVHHMECLAEIYRDEGNLDMAEEIMHQLLDAMKNMSGPIGKFLYFFHLLAKLRRKQGKLEEAFNLQRLIVRKAEETLGPLDDFTLECMSEFSQTLQGLGRLDEAIEFQMQVVAKSELNDAPHLTTFTGRYRLYTFFLDKGLVEKGLENMLHLLPAVTKEYGQQNHLTILIMDRISLGLARLDRFDEAENMVSQVLEICGRGSDVASQSGLAPMEVLAHVLHSRGQNTKAKEVVLHLLEERKRLLGPDHPDTVRVLNRLASIEGDLESQKEAEGSQ